MEDENGKELKQPDYDEDKDQPEEKQEEEQENLVKRRKQLLVNIFSARIQHFWRLRYRDNVIAYLV